MARAMHFSVSAVVLCIVLFGSAGTLAWRRGWLYVALHVAVAAVIAVLVRRRNPGVIAARSKIHKGTKRYDRIILPLFLTLTLVECAVAGLDAVRFRWSYLGAWAVWLGAVLYLAGGVPSTAAMLVNPFLEVSMRIQRERGHKVVEAGPYRLVRHPMYIGIIVQFLAVPLLLGSVWAFVPAAAIAVVLIIRTALEDATLQRELPGYGEFATRTRYRLAPGLW